MNWLFLLTLAILVIGAVIGYVNGFIKTVLHLLIGVVTMILVLILSPQVCTFLEEQTSLPSYIENKVETQIWEKIENDGTMNEGIVGEEEQENLINSLPFLPLLKNTVLESEDLNRYAMQGMEKMVGYISSVIAEKIVVLIGYVATFLVVFFILRVITFLLNFLAHVPILHGINKLAGLVLGLVEGLLIIWILGMLLVIFSATALGTSAAECISASPFLTWIYGKNMLQELVFWSIGA